MAKSGNLKVNTQNIFPIIKKFLYSDHEIFLRELVSNAVDATQKLRMLASKDEYKEELGDIGIRVKIDKEAKTLTISDFGIGMSQEEIEKYINQIAFSSAEEFVDKFKDLDDKSAIIGHFGLGFYSAFMVANKVELRTRSYREDSQALLWSCTGTTRFSIKDSERERRGTDVILHINDEDPQFLEEARISTLLKKYCSYMPVEIFLNEETEAINNPSPLWLKQPSDIKEEEYNEFYKEMFPGQPDPLFHIHLNVDYPFNLTGILYFPKINNSIGLDKNKIHLYSNQVFVTDSVNDIVPEFLTLLHGVIDSPDIPLNVSRSYLQADGNVKKISSYIVKKVADKLESIFKKERESFEEKWPDISVFIKYGMLTDEKFYDRAGKFFLVENTDKKRFTQDEYKEHVQAVQTDKDGKQVWLYTNSPALHDAQISLANNRDYDVLVFDHPIDSHLIQRLEMTVGDMQVKRVDSAPIDELISKEETQESVLSKEDEEKLVEVYKGLITDKQYSVEAKPMSPNDPPVIITQDEFGRRMREMTAMSGGAMDAGMFPDSYKVVINANHPLAAKLSTGADEAASVAQNAYDLARLANGLLSGKDLTAFINRSVEIMAK